MAVVIRNLLILCITSGCLFLAFLFHHLETRLPAKDYTTFLSDLQIGAIQSLEITGEAVEVTPKSGDDYQTTVPDAHRLLATFEHKDIQVVFHQDRSWMYFLGILFAGLLLTGLVIVLSLVGRRNNGDDLKFARDKLVRPQQQPDQVKFADVAGIPEAKEELEEVVTFLKNPGKFRAIGASIPRGLLLQGPPGTGKTLLAKAIAGEAGVPFYSFSGSDFVEMFVGVGASRVRDLFAEAKKNSPCLVFIDEIDAVGSVRAGSTSDGNDERGQTLNALLVEMDGFSSTDNVLVLGATNRPDVLDPALRRPGRFDRQITILPPDVRGRIEILATHSSKMPLDEEVSLEEVAQFTSGFTGAELASLVNEAALLAARQGKMVITPSHFDLARDRILLGVERKGMVLTEKDKRILACHEAGHAIVAKLLPESDPIHKISIIPRGRALGQTQQMPLGDRHAYGKRYLMNRVSSLLGGRAAEKMVFHEYTTRAENDLVQATEIATKMICKWGMSEILGPQSYLVEDNSFLDGVGFRQTMSNDTQSLIDQEVKELLNRCYNQAFDILNREKYFLKVLSEILLQVETLDSEEFEIIYQCSLTKKKQKYGPKIEESECAVCPAKGHCMHN